MRWCDFRHTSTGQPTSHLCRRLVSRRVVEGCRRSVDLDSRRGRLVRGVHRGTIPLVARPLPVSGYHFYRIGSDQNSFVSGRLRLTGKLLDSYFDTHRALRPIYVEYEAKFVAGSGKLASWFAAAECFHRPTQAGALWRSGCSQFAKKLILN